MFLLRTEAKFSASSAATPDGAMVNGGSEGFSPPGLPEQAPGMILEILCVLCPTSTVMPELLPVPHRLHILGTECGDVFQRPQSPRLQIPPEVAMMFSTSWRRTSNNEEPTGRRMGWTRPTQI
ncbi:hypothetical protein GDO81_020452 [Engystomops pustulosus]|uniref:Uncharacterized protein n=1 Tax=Engystomops pustulosus TaxID=76066 RepID=A0AAV6Z9R1_ENGPU|nr:hypothetical protein GDO81_020452 [Engystomops pustulosus]